VLLRKDGGSSTATGHWTLDTGHTREYLDLDASLGVRLDSGIPSLLCSNVVSYNRPHPPL